MKSNIYHKQMRELGLNVKQYADLIGMPYEAVKDVIYDKEGNYSMEIKSLLRKNMMDKHQKIESDFENSKIKAMEIKQQNDSMNWYINEYTPEMLKEKLNLKSRKAFQEKYDIIIDDKKASSWFYNCILGKINYDNHEIRKDVVEQFVDQLYDILVNGNVRQYLNNGKSEVKPVVHKQKTNILKWFKSFDFKKYLKENDMSRTQLAENCDMNYTTLCHLIKKQRRLSYETENMKKLYDYVVNNKTPQPAEVLDLPIEIVKAGIEKIENEQPLYVDQQPIECDDNELLRRILVERLTDQEKMLIKLFGGKLD